MAFFEKGNSVPVDPKFLSYSYPETTLFNEGQVNPQHLTYYSANYYYKITYPHENGQLTARLTYAVQGIPTIYTPTYMYIFSLLHNNITGITSPPDPNYVGELVIEHKNNNNDNKLFLCILLKKTEGSVGGKPSSIDNIIQMKNSDPTATSITDSNQYKTSCQLMFETQDIQKNQNCFIYNDTINPNNTVIILTEPIIIGNPDNATLISKLENTTDLFSISAANNYQSLTSGAITNAPPETSDNNVLGREVKDEIYIDCQPTGPSIKEITSYNIPIGSALSQDMQKLDFMKTSVNFFLFCLGLVLLYMGVPMLYKMVVIDKTLSKVEGDLERKKTIRGADILLCSFMVYYILSSFYYGFQGDGDMVLITNGLFAFVVLGISISLILVKKLDPDFMRHVDDKIEPAGYNEDKDHDNTSYTDMTTVFGILASIAGFMTSTNGALLHILAVDFIVFMLLIIFRYGTKTIPNDKAFADLFKRYCLFYIPLFVALFIFLSQP